jgi:predicted ester cyclase
MAPEDNKRIARDFIEGMWNRRDMSVADRYIAPDMTPQGPMSDQFAPGPEGSKAFTSAFLSAFPDVQATIDEQETEGDLVHTWVTFRGTQTGQLMDIPATGRRATVPVHITDRIVNGKIIESWAEWDPDDMFRQLGVG